ncbi:hypothetical protein [Candidatus Proelusimicrobium excrementi]|uniref:hypothetical protein n=1 Tax=Candidatus Proelusimicrobium excrementi TaxID=3416222 RepID=UPI003D0DC498
MAETKNKPIKSYRLGNVEASVWPNKNPKDGSLYFSFNFQKSYKNKDGEWVQTGFYNRGDLAYLAILAQKILCEEISPIERKKSAAASSAQAQYEPEPPAADSYDDAPF